MADPQFYFAWLGGQDYPAFSAQVTGNVWGGSLQTSGDVWGGQLLTQGDLLVASTSVTNVRDTVSLVEGESYYIQGPGIPQSGGNPSTTFTYDGSDGLTLSAAPYGVVGAGMAAASLRISSEDARTKVTGIPRTDGLVVGRTYDVAGTGIVSGTTIVFEGSDSLTLSQKATATTWQASLTLTNTTDRNVIRLDDIGGLIYGQSYQIFGPGVPNGAFFTFYGLADVTISQPATATKTGGFYTILKGRTENDGGPFDATVHNVVDEDIFELAISQAEGEFAVLDITVKNPKVGLLGTNRKLWCWLSWDDGNGTITPLFHGRIVGVPEVTADEIVRLQFVAKPVDYESQRLTLAAGLRVLPYFDPVFIQSKLYDPDTALEAYSRHWHIDRTSLLVTASDILEGEDGTITLGQDDHFYDGFDLTYGQAPLVAVNVRVDVTWKQAGEGDVDLTDSLVKVFRDAGSPYESPFVGSYTSDGLLSAWPKPDQSLGGGWSMSNDSTATLTDWVNGVYYDVSYIDKNDTATTSTTYQNTSTTASSLISNTYDTWTASFPLYAISVGFSVHWNASRDRSEQLVFTLTADTQPVLADPGSTQSEVLNLSSQVIDQPIDDTGGLPLGDTRRNTYFLTDRGDQSTQYLLLLARARLRQRSRAASVKCAMPWQTALGLTLRKSIALTDYRLPGGRATGKVTAYSLKASGRGEMFGEATIGCAVGYGIALLPAASATDLYADNYADSYTSSVSLVDLIDGELQYQPAAGIVVVDDDGVDLFNMTPDNVIKTLAVYNGVTDQKSSIDTAAKSNTLPDPVGALKRSPTEVDLELVPVIGGAFHTDILIATKNLVIPKLIDLEAA